jgi:cephalosporin hydroxylase
MKIDETKIYLDNKEIELYSKDGFKLLSDLWVKVGWDQKHLYGFSWLGRPIIQLPDDMIRFQEVIWDLKPDIIIETGIAHGGSLIFSSSLLKLIGNKDSKVIGVDIDIRKHNLDAIVNHPLSDRITMIEGSSIDSNIIKEVKNHINNNDKVIVVLDSCHDYEHVIKELELYSKIVSIGSYIVCTDGVQKDVIDTPRAIKEYVDVSTWNKNNPYQAIIDFVNINHDFIISEPEFPFNEGNIDFRITHWPSAYIKRIK